MAYTKITSKTFDINGQTVDLWKISDDNLKLLSKMLSQLYIHTDNTKYKKAEYDNQENSNRAEFRIRKHKPQ
jgi:hypothetical protein